VACIHLAALRLPHPDEPYFYKTSMLGYDYEPMYALGSMLGISDPRGMLQLMDEVEIQGLDAMSSGVALAWATEALERGLVSEDEMDGLGLAWGEHDTYIQAVRRIVSQPTGFYRALARGADHAASIYGGKGFALTFGGNEMPGYHTGPAAHLTALTGARHSHLDSAGYGVDQRAAREGEPLDPQEVAESLLEEERWRQVLASLVICFFARGVYSLDIVQRALAVAGFDCSEDDLIRIGAETLRRKYAFKMREGFDAEGLRIPGRILETPTPLGRLDEAFMRQAVAHFVEHL
jgi:aldehyde:ferredoxin oxidoreductase